VIIHTTLNQKILQLERLEIAAGGIVFTTQETVESGDAALSGVQACCLGSDAERLSGLLAAFLAAADGMRCQLL